MFRVVNNFFDSCKKNLFRMNDEYTYKLCSIQLLNVNFIMWYFIQLNINVIKLFWFVIRFFKSFINIPFRYFVNVRKTVIAL